VAAHADRLFSVLREPMHAARDHGGKDLRALMR